MPPVPRTKKRRAAGDRQPSVRASRPVVQAAPAAPAEPKPLSASATFGDLALPASLQNAVTEVGLKTLTSLQRKTIPGLLAGKDLVTITPSTLSTIYSFLIPCIATLCKSRFSPRNGTGIVILAPTRETAITISNLASTLLAGSTASVGLLVAGSNKSAEEDKIQKGINLVVATPQRLLEHLRELPSFTTKNTKGLVLYNTDALLAQEKAMLKTIMDITAFLPATRFTAVYADALTDGVHGLSELLTRPAAVLRVEDSTVAVPTTPILPSTPLGFTIVDPEDRLLLLLTFLKKFADKKVLITCSSSPAVQFYDEAAALLNIPVLVVHAKDAKSAPKTIAEFNAAESGILIAAQELLRPSEIKAADWVVQVDPPRSVAAYIARAAAVPAARTVVFLQPQEAGFVDDCKAAGAQTEEFVFPKKALMKVGPLIEKAVKKDFAIHGKAKDAFRAYLADYNLQPDTRNFVASDLDVTKVAKAYGFPVPPRVNVNVVEEKKIDLISRPYGPEEEKKMKKRRVRV